MAYFSRKQVMKLPEQYILQWWLQSLKARRVFPELGRAVNEACDPSMLVTRNSLFQQASSVIDDAFVIEGGADVVGECLLLARKKLALMKSSHVDGEESSIQMSIQPPLTLGSQVTLKEPLLVRTKGCGKRLKGGKEKAMVKKGRKCSACGKVGVSHDKRNCPELLKRMSQDGKGLNDEDEDDFEDEDDVEVESGSGD